MCLVRTLVCGTRLNCDAVTKSRSQVKWMKRHKNEEMSHNWADIIMNYYKGNEIFKSMKWTLNKNDKGHSAYQKILNLHQFYVCDLFIRFQDLDRKVNAISFIHGRFTYVKMLIKLHSINRYFCGVQKFTKHITKRRERYWKSSESQ